MSRLEFYRHHQFREIFFDGKEWSTYRCNSLGNNESDLRNIWRNIDPFILEERTFKHGDYRVKQTVPQTLNRSTVSHYFKKELESLANKLNKLDVYDHACILNRVLHNLTGIGSLLKRNRSIFRTHKPVNWIRDPRNFLTWT